MADTNGSHEQPDFHPMSQAHLSISNEIQKMQNLPAIDMGVRLLTELREMRREVQEIGNDTRRELRELRVDVRDQIERVLVRLQHRYTSSSFCLDP